MWTRENRVHIEFRLADLLVRRQFLVSDGGRHASGRAARWNGSRASAWCSASTCMPTRSTPVSPRDCRSRRLSARRRTASLDDLRQTFLVKAFQRRQAALLNHLVGAGRPARRDRRADAGGAGASCRSTMKAQSLVRRYLERRAVVGPAEAGCARFCRRGRSAAKARRPLGLCLGPAARRRQRRIQQRSLPRTAFRALRSRDALRAKIESFFGIARIRSTCPDARRGTRRLQRATV